MDGRRGRGHSFGRSYDIDVVNDEMKDSVT